MRACGQNMKTFVLAFLCSLVCTACARQMTTLSDGQPGYAITCDTVREQCIDEITRLCGANSFIIVSERANEIGQGIWRRPNFTSRYWMEVRCDHF